MSLLGICYKEHFLSVAQIRTISFKFAFSLGMVHKSGLILYSSSASHMVKYILTAQYINL